MQIEDEIKWTRERLTTIITNAGKVLSMLEKVAAKYPEINVNVGWDLCELSLADPENQNLPHELAELLGIGFEKKFDNSDGKFDYHAKTDGISVNIYNIIPGTCRVIEKKVQEKDTIWVEKLVEKTRYEAICI